MRIVAGSHRGARLRAPAGRDIRPNGDRTREARFNLVAHGRPGHPRAGQ
ncbi:MAG: RsmD family RNA methyltransferase, partial [Pseudomonadota bacterium]|nr:RsmD family RNA methyltransferase [Pseudomonadota bacterium]